jgi:hypothetical protein
MEDIKRKRRNRRVRLSILVCILVITIIGALGFYSSNRYVTFNKVVVTGTRIINISEVERTVEAMLAGKYLYIFSRNNSFIYPENQIYDKLMATFPRIDRLSLRRDGLNNLKIEISERAGSYLYCGASVPEVEVEVGENCYFVNNDGYIFDKAPYFSGNVYFKYYVPLPENTEPLSSQMLPSEDFHKLVRFVDGISSLGLKPTHLVIGAINSFLYLEHEATATAPYIILKGENNLEDIFNNLSSSMEKSEFANEIHSKYTTLLYIDLRFKNKVLYKFQ